MKAILEFDLPEEDFEFERASKATDLHCLIFDMDQYLQKKYKHVEPAHESCLTELDEIRDKWIELLAQYEIPL